MNFLKTNCIAVVVCLLSCLLTLSITSAQTNESELKGERNAERERNKKSETFRRELFENVVIHQDLSRQDRVVSATLKGHSSS